MMAHPPRAVRRTMVRASVLYETCLSVYAVSPSVMAGLVPAIHGTDRPPTDLAEKDARTKSGHDGVRE